MNNTVYTEEDILEASDGLRDIHELLDSTDYRRIYLTSDWHLLKYKYKSDYTGKGEKNKINGDKIISWCKKNIGPNDVFMFLGDLGYRWLNEADCRTVQEIYKSLPGIKVLILGNHDRMQGPDFYTKCGFDYIFEELIHDSIIFTHRPVDIDKYPNIKLNIHGHIHDMTTYWTTDGKHNVNVYPSRYNNKCTTLDYVIRHVKELTKDNHWQQNYGYGEAAIEETKRSNLPDSAFGIPEDRKFPLDTEQHVKSAIKLFGHAEASKKHSLAHKIKNAASKYGIKIPETTQVYKYLSEAGIIPDGTDTVIFDMGSVLVGDDTRNCMIRNNKIPNEMIEEIYTYIGGLIDSAQTHTMTLEEFREFFKTSKYYIYFDEICKCFVEGLYIYDYTFKMLKNLKERGYKLFYLSNWERWLYELEKDVFAPLLEYFDGGLFSFEIDKLKPDISIYKALIEKYDIEESKAIFFDDKYENIVGSEDANIKGVLFSNTVTPTAIMEADVHQKQTIIIDSEGSIKDFDISNIHWWYADENRFPSDIDEKMYFKSIEDAISSIMNKSSEPDLPEDTQDNELYIFICNGTRQDLDDWISPICVGQVSVKPDRQFEWIIQYPIRCEDGVFMPLNNEPVNEAMALNAINPIASMKKAYVIKIDGLDNTVSNTQYLLSPDIISDKYFAINEDGHIYIETADNLSSYNINSIYEYTGNKYRLAKIYKAYKESKVVDNTFFYTALTDKPMLSDDQIKFDSSFSDVNLELMIENRITDLASAHKIYIESMYGDIYYEDTYIEPNNSLYRRYKDSYMLEIKMTPEGYAVYSAQTNRISSIVESVDMISDNMLKSVMGVSK